MRAFNLLNIDIDMFTRADFCSMTCQYLLPMTVEQVVPHKHQRSPVLRPAESAELHAPLPMHKQKCKCTTYVAEITLLCVLSHLYVQSALNKMPLLTQWLSLLFEHAASTRCGFAWLSTSALCCCFLLHCQRTVVTLCETTLICQTRIAELETRFDPQKHGQRNRRHRGSEVAGVVADCRHGDNHRFASHSSHCMRRPSTRGTQLLCSAVL